MKTKSIDRKTNSSFIINNDNYEYLLLPDNFEKQPVSFGM